MKKEKVYWPSWRYGPNGEAEIFERPEDVPVGWEDHPTKVKAAAAKKADQSAANERTRRAVDTNKDDYGSVREIAAALAASTVTFEEIEAAEVARESPRSTVLAMVEKARKSSTKQPSEEDLESREYAITYIRDLGGEISDSATDEEITAALDELEESK